LKPKINIITIGVDDLERAAAFYHHMLDLPEDQIAVGDDHIAFFLDDRMSLVLLPRPLLAQSARVENPVAHGAELVFSHTARTPAEVDEILARAVEAGGSVHQAGEGSEWGYAGYFKDPDGHLWEIMASPDR